MRPRVAFVVPGFPDPAEDWPVSAVIARAAQQVEATVFALSHPRGAGRSRRSGAEVVVLDGGRSPAALARGAFAALRKFDIVHAFWADLPGAVGALLALAPGRRLVVTCAGGDLGVLPDLQFGSLRSARGRWLVRSVLGRAARIVAGSAMQAERAAALVPGVAERVRIIPLGISPERFSPSTTRPDPGPSPADEAQAARGATTAHAGGHVREEQQSAAQRIARSATGGIWASGTRGPPHAAGALLHVASLRPVKRPELALALAARIPAARLTVAGDGPLRPTLEARATALGLGERAHFLGRVPHREMPSLYATACCLVSTSAFEAEGSAILEALACGLPAVATRTGIAPEVIRDGENGFLVPVGDLAALERAVRAILAEPERFQAAARAGAERIRAELSHARAAERLTALYREILS